MGAWGKSPTKVEDVLPLLVPGLVEAEDLLAGPPVLVGRGPPALVRTGPALRTLHRLAYGRAGLSFDTS